jgi:hypothetical protein
MYKLKYHKTLASRWFQFPRSQQILGIANELWRAKNLLNKKDYVESKNALERAFELIDLTIDLNYTPTEMREFLRFREMLGHLYINEPTNVELLEKLFHVLISLDKDSYNSLL